VELFGKLSDYTVITTVDLKSDFSINQDASDRIKRAGGLAYEKYEQDDHFFGKYDDSFDALSDEELVARAADFVGEIVSLADPRLSERRDIEEIKRSVSDETTRDTLIKARRGQGKFRQAVFDLWGGCAITRCTVPEVLRASHIKPWSLCTGETANDERLDPHNGLLLTATLDALFDKGLISFDDKGDMLISSQLVETQRPLVLNLERKKIIGEELSSKQKKYLKFHRENIFRP
jgi:predicted restriction endonuclease